MKETGVSYQCDRFLVNDSKRSTTNETLLNKTDDHVSISVTDRYDTAYACEGKILRIECGEGKLIHLIRANYGRFSITICNEHGNTDWSVNCMSPKSFRVLNSE